MWFYMVHFDLPCRLGGLMAVFIRPILLLILATFSVAHAAEPPACRKVTLVDTGQPEVTASTALTAILLAGIGYEVRIRDLDLQDGYMALGLGEADIFLGARMAPEIDGLGPFLTSGAVEVVGPNLSSAGYGIATNSAGAALGITGMRDLAAHHAAFDGRIHGVAPGDAGNLAVMEMIARDQFDTGIFELVESSERGLIAQLARAEERNRPLVVIARHPHPMNARFDLHYLTNGDEVFGTSQDIATIRTITRANLSSDCQNLGRFLENLAFTPELLTKLIIAIQEDHQDPHKAAEAALRADFDQAAPWLTGVTAQDHPDAMTSLKAALNPRIR